MSKDKRKHLLVILPHPDDESFPMGGTLAKYAADHTLVSLVCATRGEAGVEGLPLQEAAALREGELRCAADALGLDEVRFLDYLDGTLAQVGAGELVERLVAILREMQPDAVITFGPDGISGHPDHTTLSARVTQAFDRAAQPGARLFYLTPSKATLQGCGVIPTQEAAGGPVASLDIGAYRLPKVRAMQCHTSQNPPFKGKPEQEIENLACHETFTLARPLGHYATLTDLFAPLRELKEDHP
ncbi:MAG TPA: PIG-L deacetylase family protein [Anaerolineales bacterium]